MKKITLLIFLLSIPAFGWTCSCVSLTKKDAKRLTKEADFVISGTAVENVHHNDSLKTLWDSEEFGIHVKFKVEKIYKGNLKTEFVYINQFETVATPPLPPMGGKTIKKKKCYNIEMELIEHWNKIANKEIVIYTNQCSSFQAGSTYGRYFEK